MRSASAASDECHNLLVKRIIRNGEKEDVKRQRKDDETNHWRHYATMIRNRKI